MSKRFNNQTYFQMCTGFEDPFTRVPNSILDEKNISAKSLGIYVKIIRFQNSTKHKIYISSLANELKEGKDAIRTAIHELMNLGYIERKILRNEKGHMNGYVYTVHAQPIEKTITQPKSDNPKSVNPHSDNTTLKKKINKKENNKKENNVVVDEKENQLLELYKSFKLEKRVMPHTIKLLKEYKDKFDLEVFEQVFISASEESTKKKYSYIKEVFEKLVIKNIKTLNDFEEDNKKYKENKSSIKKSFNKSNSNKITTRFHDNCNQTFKKYTEDELNKKLKESQEGKFNKNNDLDLIDKALSSEEFYNSLTPVTQQIVKNTILENNDFIPYWIK